MNSLSAAAAASPSPSVGSNQTLRDVDELLLRGEEFVLQALHRLVDHLALHPRDEAVIEKLGRILSQNPALFRSHPSRQVLARVAVQLRELALSEQDPDKAMNIFYVASYLDPGQGLGHYRIAKEMMQTAQYEEALPFLLSACAQDQQLADCQLQQGIALVKLERFQEAIPCLRRAIDPGASMRTGYGDVSPPPAAIETRFYLAVALMHIRETREALSLFEYVVDAQPTHWEARQYLGQLLPSLLNPTVESAKIQDLLDDSIQLLTEALNLRAAQERQTLSSPPSHYFAILVHQLVTQVYPEAPFIQRELLFYALAKFRQFASDATVQEAINQSTGEDTPIQELRQLAIAKLTQWAADAESRGDIKGAIVLLKQILFLEQNDRVTTLKIIRLCFNLNDCGQALYYLNPLANAPIVPVTIHYYRSLCHILLGNWDQALQARQQIEKRPIIPGWPHDIPLILEDIHLNRSPREILDPSQAIFALDDCHAVPLRALCLLLAHYFDRQNNPERHHFFQHLAELPELTQDQKDLAIAKLTAYDKL